MRFWFTASPRLLVAFGALIVLTSASMTMPAAAFAETTPANAEPVEASFRGCESAGWCRFRIESLAAPTRSLHRVYPDGVLRAPGDAAMSIAVRDRLNALLASMIHQHKQIVLHDLREVEDGIFAATVTVNGVSLESDPILLELAEEFTGTPR